MLKPTLSTNSKNEKDKSRDGNFTVVFDGINILSQRSMNLIKAHNLIQTSS
jgi:hypothetical protein